MSLGNIKGLSRRAPLVREPPGIFYGLQSTQSHTHQNPNPFRFKGVLRPASHITAAAATANG